MENSFLFILLLCAKSVLGVNHFRNRYFNGHPKISWGLTKNKNQRAERAIRSTYSWLSSSPTPPPTIKHKTVCVSLASIYGYLRPVSSLIFLTSEDRKGWYRVTIGRSRRTMVSQRARSPAHSRNSCFFCPSQLYRISKRKLRRAPNHTALINPLPLHQSFN